MIINILSSLIDRQVLKRAQLVITVAPLILSDFMVPALKLCRLEHTQALAKSSKHLSHHYVLFGST